VKRIKNNIIPIILVSGAFIALMPILWMISTSLKDSNSIFSFPLKIIPDPVHWENYSTIWKSMPLVQYFKNSILITGLTIIGTVFSSALVAYGFSILEWKNRDKVFIFIIFTMMIPLQVIMVPVFVIFKQLGWLNTFKPLIVPAFLGGGAFNIFLFRQFFLNIPREIIDAAKMDGLSHFQIFKEIALPISKPVIATISILTFMFTWNDFMGPLIYLSDQIKGTLALGIMMFVGQHQTEWGELMAVSILMMLPMLIVFFVFQKYFIRGLMIGGSKS
jgi:multiple sugar transport system permease protein|tara:strand:+ start:96 stop:920 length:825 start_codon:yes stop_codon:yes gene_type:complete